MQLLEAETKLRIYPRDYLEIDIQFFLDKEKSGEENKQLYEESNSWMQPSS